MSREPVLCNLFAQRQGLDPVGYAGTLDAVVALELPLPWPRGIFSSPGKLPAGVHAAVERFSRDARYRLRPLVIGPDPLYTVAGRRRVMWLQRPEGPLSGFRRVEYLVPTEHQGELVAALIDGRGHAPAFDDCRVEATERDLLVCTHGSEDAACGRYGVPIYRQLRAQAESAGVRVWRVCHFGGHVFAPTLLELPAGRFWAYLDEEGAGALLRREGDPERLRGLYRGWAALEGPFLQALERELLAREGWSWLDAPKTASLLEIDPDPEPQWARARIDAWFDGDRKTCIGRVEVSHTLPIRPRSDSPEIRPYAQYRVTDLAIDGTPQSLPAPNRPASTGSGAGTAPGAA